MKLIKGVSLALFFLAVLPLSVMAETTYIIIADLQFQPTFLNISTGTTVTWLNYDWTGYYGRRHIIAAHYAEFRSPRLEFNDSFSVTFDEPGTYTYIDPIYRSSTGGAFIKKGVITVT